MGVTLERVQFKFASIIGELCSEPDILSQFAVWVDLRLAEYKLKGSISLDCSGDTPDPVWLKGILSALLEKRLTALKSADQHIGRGVVGNPMFHSTPITQRVGSAGLKQEATDEAADIFPVGFHAHRNTDNAPYSSYDFRKRRACETVTRHDSNSAYPAKMRRVENTKDDPIVISHESLMSVLNPRDGEDGATVPGNTDPSNSEHTTEISLSSDVDTTLHHRESYENDAEGGPNADDVVLRMVTETSRRDPKRDTRGITRAYDSARRIRSDVNSFQSWLISSSHGDSRKIEAIPPEELDTLLVDFFSTIKTRSGGDYDPNSLSALRSCLERHLREQGYQHLISSSPIFRQSQAAFKAKKQMLKMASNLSPPDIVVLRLNKLIGPFTPESLLNVLYWRNSFFFPCLRTKIDHFNLLWGDFKIIDAEDDLEYLALTGEASRSEQKSVSFLRFLNPMHSMVRAMPEDPDICPVEIFKEYRRHRPAGSLLPTSNFYLRPRDGTDLDSDVWFLNAPLGLHDIAKLIKVMKEKSGLLPSSD